MADNEKLLEAARMIQEHCEHTEMGTPCPLAFNGVCDGTGNCGVCERHANGFIPSDWKIPKPCRWTEADALLAKALILAGYTSARFLDGCYDGVFASGRDMVETRVPRGLLCGADSYKGVKLADIIAEYSEVTGHEV